MLVDGARHLGHRPQVAANLLLERAGALSVEDGHRAYAHHQRIVHQVLHRLERLGGPHAPHVDVVAEVELARRDVNRDAGPRRLGTRRLAVLVVRDHQPLLLDGRENLPEGHLRPPSLD